MNPFTSPDRGPEAQAWRNQARCLQLAKADVMYPDPGDRKATDWARAVCAGCPVAGPCLESALAEEGGRTKDSRYGVRAGKTPSQRYAIYTSRRSSAKASA